MSLTYDSYVTDLANLIVISSANANYQTVLPNIIDDAEQRIYRELDFLNTVTVFSSVSLASDTRSVTLPSTVICVVVDSVNVLSTATVPTRTQLTPASRDWLNIVYPTAPVTWEKHYQTLKQSAIEEEFRKKFGSQGWTSKQPNPIATPPRT